MQHIYKILMSILLLSTIMVGIADAVPIEEWNKTFGGTGYDYIYSINQTTDGGYILAGSTSSYGSGLNDAWLIKTDSLGNKQWSKTFGGVYSDGANSVQQTKDGGYILAGVKDLDCGTDPDLCGSYAWLLKTDSFGNVQWSKTFSFLTLTMNGAYSVQQTKDGGYIIAGYSLESDDWGEAHSGWLLKTDSLGNIQWNKIFGGGNFDVFINFYQARQTYDGGYIVVGYTQLPFDVLTYSTLLIKTDSLGNKQWNKTFSYFDVAYSIQQTKDGGYIVVGDVDIEGTNSYLMKIDSIGNIQWKKSNLSIGTTDMNDVRQTKDGGYILAGSKSVLKTDSLGNKQWSKIFPNHSIESIIQTKNGDYILAGIVRSKDAWLAKLSENNFSNIMKNPGFETSDGTEPAYWDKYQTGIRAIFTYPETGRIGGKSVAIKYPTKEVGKVALWQQSGITVSRSKQYKLSGYMKLANVTGGGIGRLNGADLRVNWYKSDGGIIKVDLITKSGTSAWIKYEKIFTSPSNAIRATVGGDLYNASGKVWFDDLSFVKIS